MVYTPVIDDKPADVIICSLHCVLVGANVGIIEGDLDGALGVDVGCILGIDDGMLEATLDGHDG